MNQIDNINCKNKKRKIQKAINNDVNLSLYINKYITPKSITFKVPSTTKDNVFHNVSINEHFVLECDCAHIYGVNTKYNHCIHIGILIGNILTKYVNNNTYYSNNNLDDILSKFNNSLKLDK